MSEPTHFSQTTAPPNRMAPVIVLVGTAVAAAIAWWFDLSATGIALAALVGGLALVLLRQEPSTVEQSGTRLFTMPEALLLAKRQRLTEELASLAASLELQRGVFEAAAELVSCVEEGDARERFLATMATYWRSVSADLFLWERGRWRALAAPASGDEPVLTAAVLLPDENASDLLLDLSPGVDGQAALILRQASPQPTLAGRSPSDQRYIAEVLRGLLALSLRRVMLYQRLDHLGRIDPLTTLFRRWYGERRLSELAEGQRTVSVAMLDIDFFKRVNDSYGHAAGDAVLRALGRHIRKTLRTGDICCRFGGEEFLLLLPQTTGSTAVRTVERLRLSVHDIADLPCPITISIGVASLRPEESMGGLIARADAALYQAKNGGRDRIVAAESDDASPIQSDCHERTDDHQDPSL